jgi:hypothetical protein
MLYFKEHLPEDGHNRRLKRGGPTLFVIQQIYMSVYALVGRISRNELSVHGHESFKVGIVCVCVRACVRGFSLSPGN